MNYLRLDNPDNQLTTDGGDWIYSVTDRWTNRIDQGELKAPTKVSDSNPPSTGEILNRSTTVENIAQPLVTVQYSFKPANKLAPGSYNGNIYQIFTDT